MATPSPLSPRILCICCIFLLVGSFYTTGCISLNPAYSVISDDNSTIPSPVVVQRIVTNTVSYENPSQPCADNPSTTPIYFSVFPSQIWRIAPADSRPQIVHEITPNNKISVTDIFPPTELARLQDYLEHHSITTTVQELTPTFALQLTIR